MTSTDPRSALPAGGAEVFRSVRLLVRSWRSSDEAGLLELYSIKEVVRWIDDGQPLSAQEAARWMEVTFSNYETRGYGMFAIEEVRSKKTIGFGGLVHPGVQVDAEVKYAFLPEAWGQGLATEFVKGLIEWARSTHGLTRVIATVDPENFASQRVLLKSGFRRSETQTESDGNRTEIFELRP